MDINLKCACGTVTGMAHQVSPGAGNHLICMCTDCRDFAKFLGRAEDLLDEYGGTQLFQMPPAYISITSGHDQFRCIRLSPNGILRWYAECCKTPVGNTMPSAKIPFAGLVTSFFDIDPQSSDFTRAFGPVTDRCFGRSALTAPPPGSSSKAKLRTMASIASLIIKGLIRGRHRPSPYFDDSGQPVSTPVVLPREQRTRLG